MVACPAVALVTLITALAAAASVMMAAVVMVAAAIMALVVVAEMAMRIILNLFTLMVLYDHS